MENVTAKKPDDFVIATNTVYSVKFFINECLKYLNLPVIWKGKGIKEVAIDKNSKKIIIKINPKYYRPAEVDYLRGSYIKAKKILNWKPKHNITGLIKDMLKSDLSRLS